MTTSGRILNQDYVILRMRKWIEPALHVVLWGLTLWVVGMSFSIESVEVTVVNDTVHRTITRDYNMFIPIGIGVLGKAILFYGNVYWAFPTGFLKKRWVQYIAQVLFLLGVALGIERILLFLFITPGSPDSTSLFSSLSLNLLLFLLILGISLAYAFFRHYQKTEEIRERISRESVQTELSYLKSQINPHFLFNTLNNLFSMAEVGGQAQLASGIAQLSRLMRYMLDDAQADRLPLAQEITYLKSVVEIHKLRLGEDDDMTVAFNVEGDTEKYQVAPLLLVPFVENAFKHGTTTESGALIKIDLTVKNDALLFEVINSVPESKRSISERSGIGLDNVKRRLELQYPGHTLTHGINDQGFFHVRLLIPLV